MPFRVKDHLGVFIIDLSTADTEQYLREDMVNNILLSIVSVLCLVALVYLLIQWLLVRRVDVIHNALTNWVSTIFPRGLLLVGIPEMS